MRPLLPVVLLFLVCPNTGETLAVDDSVNSSIGGKKKPLSLGIQKTHHGVDPRVLRAARSQGKVTSSSSDLPLGGSIWPLSLFWTWVEVGTPPKRFAALVDSGSEGLYIPGEGCTGCAPHDEYNPRYSPNESKTSNPLPGSFSATYSTCDPLKPNKFCSFSGVKYNDFAGFPGYNLVNMEIHSIKNQSLDFYQSATIGSIVGMSPSYADNHTVWWEQCGHQVAGSNCTDRQWGICMHPGTHSNGTLTIGGIDPELAEDGKIAYVDAEIGKSALNVTWIGVGGKQIPLSLPGTNGTYPWPCLVDTGTNNFLIPGIAYWPLWSEICEKNKNLKYCYELAFDPNFCGILTEEEIAAYPPFQVHIPNGNLTIEVSPQAYLVKNSPLANSPDQVCNGIAVSGVEGVIIFGDVVMRDYYVVWDAAHNNGRMGWGKVNKTKCGSLPL